MAVEAERRKVRRSSAAPIARTPAQRLSVALLCAALAIVSRSMLGGVLGARYPYITLFPSIMVAAWYGGLWPALVVTAAGLVFSVYTLVAPAGSWPVTDRGDLTGWILVAIVGVGVGALGETLHRALRRLSEVAIERGKLVEALERARETAETQRARLFDIFQRVPARVTVLRVPDFEYVFVNDHLAEFFGPGAVIGAKLRDALPTIEAQGFLERLRTVARTGEPYVGTEVPITMPRAGGTIEERYFDITYEPMLDDEGVVTEIFSFVYDVTATVRARRSAERLAERLDRVQAVTRGLANARTIEDVAAQVIHDGVRAAGADTCSVMLVSDDGKSLVAIANHGVAPEVAAAIARVPRDRKNPANLAIDTGRPVWIETAAEYVERFPELASTPAEGPRAQAFWCVPLIAEGRAIGAIGMGYLTARRYDEEERAFVANLADQAAQAFERVRSSEAERRATARLRMLADASRTLGASLDTATTLADLARMLVPVVADWCAIDLVADGEAVPDQVVVAHAEPNKVEYARELRKRYPPLPTDPTGVVNVLRTGVSELYPQITDEMLRAGSRDEQHLQISRELGLTSAMVVPMPARGRTVGALTLVATNPETQFSAEDLRFAEELAARAAIAIDNAQLFAQAESSIALRDDFLSIASHELNTPLTALKMQLGALRRKERAPELVAEKLAIIDRQVDRLTVLVRQLLDVSRIASGRLELHPEPFDLTELVGDVVTRYREAATHSGPIGLHAAAPVEGQWDRARLEQVVTNLVSNALKYGAEGPVDVEVRDEGDRALLVVRDRGIGIDLAQQSRIFERFERAVSSRNFGGFGLGLWIVRQVIEASGGTIGVVSAPGQGSTFTVSLPKLPPVPRSPRASSRGTSAA